jgi:hypothetical protein
MQGILRQDRHPARHDGREQSFKILSEDEADPSRGTVSPMYRRSPGPF